MLLSDRGHSSSGERGGGGPNFTVRVAAASAAAELRLPSCAHVRVEAAANRFNYPVENGSSAANRSSFRARERRVPAIVGERERDEKRGFLVKPYLWARRRRAPLRSTVD